MLSLLRRTSLPPNPARILRSILAFECENSILTKPPSSPTSPQHHTSANKAPNGSLSQLDRSSGSSAPSQCYPRFFSGFKNEEPSGKFVSRRFGCLDGGNEENKAGLGRMRERAGGGEGRASLAMMTSTPPLDSGELGRVVAAGFRKKPQQMAADIAKSLGSLDRSLLISALSAAEANSPTPWTHSRSSLNVENYAAALFDKADQNTPKGLLDKEEFIAALHRHSTLQRQQESEKGRLPVRGKSLMLLAVATGIPYIGFGFLDNFIMIIAGEKIESAFGLALGISTMAAAALGNTFSDIAGIWMAETIEQKSKSVKSLRPPRLSRAQETMTSVRVAKGTGAVVGVIIGCTLGMAPLLYYTPV